MGAPTSSGVFFTWILLELFVAELLVFWSNLYDWDLWPIELFFLLASLPLIVFVKFLGFSISWIGGLLGLLIEGFAGLENVIVSFLKLEGILFFRSFVDLIGL